MSVKNKELRYEGVLVVLPIKGSGCMAFLTPILHHLSRKERGQVAMQG